MKNSSFKLYSTLLLVFSLIGIVYLSTAEKGDFYLWVNSHYSAFGDVFFKYVTYLGDGAWFAVFAIAALFYNYYKGAVLVASGLTQLIVIQGLKRRIFRDNPRPSEYFKDLDGLHFVAGVDVHSWNSFPSGHSATAFGLAAIIILLYQPSPMKTVLLFVLACLIGFSRIYLSQHFLQDVIVGALIGSIIAVVIFKLMESIRAKTNPESKFYTTGIKDKLI